MKREDVLDLSVGLLIAAVVVYVAHYVGMNILHDVVCGGELRVHGTAAEPVLVTILVLCGMGASAIGLPLAFVMLGEAGGAALDYLSRLFNRG